MVIAITREDWIHGPKDPTEVHGHFWFMDSSKTELGPGGGIYVHRIGLFFLWVRRHEKNALEGGYTPQKEHHC
jgi:hypothetical protein